MSLFLTFCISATVSEFWESHHFLVYPETPKIFNWWFQELS